MDKVLDGGEIRTLLHCLDVAAQTFAEHVKTFAAAQPNPMFTAEAIATMGKQFAEYEADARALHDKIEGAYQMRIERD